MGFTKVSLLIQNQRMTICLLVPALLRRGCWPSEHCRGLHFSSTPAAGVLDERASRGASNKRRYEPAFSIGGAGRAGAADGPPTWLSLLRARLYECGHSF